MDDSSSTSGDSLPPHHPHHHRHGGHDSDDDNDDDDDDDKSPKYDSAGERLLDAVLDLDLESPMPAPIENLTAGSPYFLNGLVRVDISWNKPDDNGATKQVIFWGKEKNM